MNITIDNITWQVKEKSYWDKDYGKSLGLAAIGIPFTMLKRFIKECAWSDDLKVPPHYFQEDKESLFTGCVHDCYNADTQIVLMKWLHDKKRKYNLEYRTDDPFWIFHDHCHSQGDVCGYEVGNITANVEHYRLIEGAEMAKHYGFTMKAKPTFDLIETFNKRFRESSTRLNYSDFESYMDSKEKELFDYLATM